LQGEQSWSGSPKVTEKSSRVAKNGLRVAGKKAHGFDFGFGFSRAASKKAHGFDFGFGFLRAASKKAHGFDFGFGFLRAASKKAHGSGKGVLPRNSLRVLTGPNRVRDYPFSGF
jgi:hypothetical protein